MKVNNLKASLVLSSSYAMLFPHRIRITKAHKPQKTLLNLIQTVQACRCTQYKYMATSTAEQSPRHSSRKPEDETNNSGLVVQRFIPALPNFTLQI